MSIYINPQNNPQFFQQFNEKYLPGDCDSLTQFRLVEKKGGYALENKSGWSLFAFLPCLFGYSYSIERHAKSFLELVQKKVKEINSENLSLDQVPELLSCSKTCHAFQKILSHVIDRRRDKPTDAFKEQKTEFKTFSYEMLNLAASRLEVSPLALACMNKMGAHALKLISQGIRLKEAEGHYAFLLSIAHKKKERPLDLIFRLIELGADVQAAGIPLNDYLLLALENHKEQVACLLCKAGADVNKPAADGLTPFHLACRIGLIEVVKYMLNNGGDCAKTDTAGNMALHFASHSSPKEEIISLLILHSDVTRPNSTGRLPLQHLYDANKVLVKDDLNSLEKPFLLQDHMMAKKQALKMSYKEFTACLEQLATKYPKSPLGLVEFCHLDIDPHHYQKGVSKLEIPEPPVGVNLDTLFTLFDQINFADPAAPLFRNPELLYKDTRTTSPQKFRSLLGKYIHRVKEREAYLGTPYAGTAALKEFYQTIEKALKNCIHTLQQKPPSDETKSLANALIIELIRAAPWCGGRYYNAATTQFERICQGAVPTFEEEVYLFFAEYREILFQSLIDQTNDHNVNDYNYLLRHLGAKYGIPGSQIIVSFNDRFGGVNLDEAEKKFLKLYRAQACIEEWFEPQLKVNNNDFREKFVAWCKTHIPKGWQKDHFDPITQAVKEMQKTGAPETAIKEYLQTKDIFIPPNTSALDAIRLEREAAYLGTEVFNMESGKIKREAIVYFLTKLQIFSSPWSPREDIHFAESVIRIVGGWFAQIRGWLAV